MFHFKNTSKLFKKKLILGAVLLLAAIILLAALLPLAFKAKAVSYPVLVVNVGIAKGQKITADMLTVTKTTDASLAGKVAVNANDVVNQYAAVDLVADSHLLPSTVSKNELYPDIYSHLDNGMVALSVTFDSFAGSLSGKLRKDDIVTTFAVTKSETTETPPQKSYAVIPPELRYVKVIAVTDDNSVDVERNEEITAEGGSIPTTVTLLVSEQQASVLVALEQNGYLHFGLACRNDTDRAVSLLKLQEQTIASINAAPSAEGGGANG